MVAKGTLTKPLAEGKYHLEVKLGSSVVFKHDGDLCGDSSAKVIRLTGPLLSFLGCLLVFFCRLERVRVHPRMYGHPIESCSRCHTNVFSVDLLPLSPIDADLSEASEELGALVRS